MSVAGQSSRGLLGYYGLVALTSPLAVLGAVVAVVERSLGDGGELGLAVAGPFLWAVRMSRRLPLRSSTAPRVLPEDHEQAGRRFPEAGEVIESVCAGETAHDWKSYEVLFLDEDGSPAVDIDGAGRAEVISDPFEWRWPEDRRAKGETSMHRFLSLRTIQKFEPLMERLRVSEVARSDRGFLSVYKRCGGRSDRLPPDWLARREGFINRHMAQVVYNCERLFDDHGVPTRRHLALVAWAYSPDAAGLRAAARKI